MTKLSRQRKRPKTHHVCSIKTETVEELARRAPSATSVDGAIRTVLGMPLTAYYGRSVFRGFVKRVQEETATATPEDGA